MNRKCYGYEHDAKGKLIIDEEAAENVRLIYDLYLQERGVIGFVRELERRKIALPTGKNGVRELPMLC